MKKVQKLKTVKVIRQKEIIIHSKLVTMTKHNVLYNMLLVHVYNLGDIYQQIPLMAMANRSMD